MSVTRLSDAREPARFGAKAATLASLAARHRVPDGFAVAADARDEEVRALVPAAYAALGPDAAVAVGSSAICEDSREASFAGQHDTVLSVRGGEAVIEAVMAVRRSATSERAAAYRREKGIEGVPSVGVLVQRMVDATATVIAFTADPVTGDRDLVIVNACRGLGDAMAAGEVTPDLFRVRKSDLEIIFASAAPDGAAIARPQVQAVARLALELERDAGHAVDIEAAFEDGALYLLQSRPVTAAGGRDDFPITWPEPGDEQITWKRVDGRLGGAALPLSVDYWRYGAGRGIQRRNESLGMPRRFRMEEFHGRIYEGTKPLAPPEEMEATVARLVTGRLERARRLATDWPERYLPTVLAHQKRMRALRPASLSAEEAASAWEDHWQRVTEVWEIHMHTTGDAYGVMNELGQAYGEATGRPASEGFALTHGRAHTLQQLQRDMYALGETARSLPEIAAEILAGVASVDVLSELPGGERFLAALTSFLERHGDLGQQNELIESPAWRDEPRLVVHEIRRALEAPSADPDLRLARLLAESEAVATRVRDALRGRPDELERFEDILAVARAVGPLTEEHNYWVDRLTQAHVRRLVLTFGERLVADGTIERATDIFHFYVPEVAEALRRPRDLRAFVREREARHARNLRRRAPELLGAPAAATPGTLPGMIPRSELGYKEQQDDPAALRGVPACAGVARGPARLVREPADLDRVRAGDVLVCRSSNVSYVPVYGRVAAVVTEVGGSLSHAAVVAREFGLPAVVGTGVALSVLRDGDMVEVDGAAGTVRRVAARVESATPA